MAAIDLGIINRFKAISHDGHFAVFDNYEQKIATGGEKKQEMRHLTRYQASRWTLIYNIVEKNGCGMCSRRLSTVKGPVFKHPDYIRVCRDCYYLED